MTRDAKIIKSPVMPRLKPMGTGSGVAVDAPKEGKFLRLSPASVVYWSRIGFAILAGVLYNILGLGLQGMSAGTLSAIGLGIVFYSVSVFVVKYLFGYGEVELKGRRKHVSLGMGSYIIWLLFTIVLLNTILYAR